MKIYQLAITFLALLPTAVLSKEVLSVDGTALRKKDAGRGESFLALRSDSSELRGKPRDGPTALLAHLDQPKKTLLYAVKCIRPAVGIEPLVINLVNWIVKAGVKARTLAACGSTLGVGCVATVVAATAGITVATEVFKSKGGPYWLDSQFSGKDHLYVTMDGQKIFPTNNKKVDVVSQQVHWINQSRNGKPTICLFEWDWGSGDDNMGCVDTNTLGMGKNLVLLSSEAEGSIYELEIIMF